MTTGALPRYQVRYPTDGDGTITQPGSFDNLEDAGRCYLATSGATDIWDREEQRFIDPEAEVDCVADAYHKWWWEKASFGMKVEYVLRLNKFAWWRRLRG